MVKVGITGQAGFVGTHLYNELGLHPNEYQRIPFEDAFFKDSAKLVDFVAQCDVIVHLAAVNRHEDQNELYRINVALVQQLIDAMNTAAVAPYILFSSSTQEERENLYGNSKKKGRELFETWAKEKQTSFTGMVVPNVYGPFGRPNYNSFIATFCYKLTHQEEPTVMQDATVNLIYVGSLCKHIIAKIKTRFETGKNSIECDLVPFDFERKVTEILTQLKEFKSLYLDQGIIPILADSNDINLFNTYRCYIEHAEHFPVKLVKHTDPRGMFVETIKIGVGGQVSFSTTVPGITRGNHYHSRKIERFTVDFYLDGNEPSYVDMPIWYTHNISNIGEEELYTQFWINEWYNPEDGDTYFEEV